MNDSLAERDFCSSRRGSFALAQGFPPFATAGPYFLFVTCSLLKTLMLLRGFRKKVGKKLAAYSDATAVVHPTASRVRKRRHGRGTVSGC